MVNVVLICPKIMIWFGGQALRAKRRHGVSFEEIRLELMLLFIYVNHVKPPGVMSLHLIGLIHPPGVDNGTCLD